jgi:hypothetical protein
MTLWGGRRFVRDAVAAAFARGVAPPRAGTTHRHIPVSQLNER